MSDLAFMLTATAVSCLAVGLAGGLLLHAFRRRSVMLSVIVCALVPMVAVIVAVLVNVQAMFLSEHDAEVIAIVLTTAAVIAVVLAVVLGRRLAANSRLIGERVSKLTETYHPPPTPPDRPAPAELAELTAQLDDVHRKLEASRARERALEANRRDLVASLSHDLRTPLAGVRALAEGLEDGIVGDVPGALKQIRANAERITRIADDLFELSRLRALPHSARDTLVSLREVAEDVVAEARSAAAAGDVRLEACLEGRLPVRGDGDELARALANLVTNAVRHTPSGGAVSVAGSVAGGEAVVRVADGCGGIAAGDLPRVFEPGWRGSPGRSPDGAAGSGLGLAIVREVVAAHDGTVTVRNIDGGCAFEVRLPAVG